MNITTTYRNIEITYSEHMDNWNCELFSKPANDLRSAKERIDKKLDAEKKTPFTKFKAYVPSLGYQHNARSWPLVEVTSITEDGREVWISREGKREKTGKNYSGDQSPTVYPETPENTAIVEEIHRLEKQRSVIDKQITETTGRLQIWKPTL